MEKIIIDMGRLMVGDDDIAFMKKNGFTWDAKKRCFEKEPEEKEEEKEEENWVQLTIDDFCVA